MAYRNNSVFELVLPLVEQRLSEIGYRVLRVALPSEANDAQMAEMIETLKDRFGAAVCLTDNTVKSIWPSNVQTLGGRLPATLDDLMHAATVNAARDSVSGGFLGLCGQGAVEHSVDSAGYRAFRDGALKTMQNLFSLALRGKPLDLVTIFPEKLRDHPPFCYGPKDEDPGELVAGIFREMGVAPENIVVCHDLEKLDFDRIEKSPFSVCVGDRHLITTSLDSALARLTHLDLLTLSPVVERPRRENPVLQMIDGLLAPEEWMRVGVDRYRELLGLSMPSDFEFLDPNPGQRYWLSLPMESLLHSIFTQGLVKAGDCGHVDMLSSEVMQYVIDHLVTWELQHRGAPNLPNLTAS